MKMGASIATALCQFLILNEEHEQQIKERKKLREQKKERIHSKNKKFVEDEVDEEKK